MESARQGLRSKIFEGGALLMGRQLASMGLSLIGLLVITRIIGPAAYGPYVAALGICQYAQSLGQAGIGVYLVRAPGEVTRRTFDVATTLLLISALALIAILEASLGLIARWIPMPGLPPLLAVLLISVIFQTIAVGASARLERALDFRRVAMIEMAGQLLYYGLALPLVFTGFGVWSLVTGWCLQQLFLCVAFHVARAVLAKADLGRRDCPVDVELRPGLRRVGLAVATAGADQSADRRTLPAGRGRRPDRSRDPNAGTAVIHQDCRLPAVRRGAGARCSTSRPSWSRRRPTACVCRPWHLVLS